MSTMATSSIEEIAAIFDNTQEEIEDLKCDAVLKLTKMFLTHMHENNEDGQTEWKSKEGKRGGWVFVSLVFL